MSVGMMGEIVGVGKIPPSEVVDRGEDEDNDESKAEEGEPIVLVSPPAPLDVD